MPTPIPQPKAPAKPMGLIIGLGVAAVLCVAFAGVAGWLWSQKAGQSSAVALHETNLTILAEAVGEPIVASTNNVPTDWKAVWGKVATVVSNDHTEVAATRTRVAELEKQLDELLVAQTQAQKALTDAQAKSAEAETATRQLAELRDSSKKQVDDLQKLLTAAQEALAASQQTQAPTETATDSASAVSPAAAAEATAVVGTEAVAEASAPAETAEIGPSFTFPAGTSTLLKKASYDAASQKLNVVLANGTKLRYSDVPQGTFDGLCKAVVVDVFFRMRVMGVFKSEPDDLAAVRELSKNH